MGESTGIAWTHRTWNPWMGCDKVSPECAHCYMFREMRKYGRNPDVVTRSKTTFDAPLKWQRQIDAGELAPFLCFTCSWSDWFHHAADSWRPEAWAIVKACPGVFFQILTKGTHPGNAARRAAAAAGEDWQAIDAVDILSRLPDDWGDGYPNVALGMSIGIDPMSHRADTLRKIPARVRFVSAEPLLSELPSLDLTGIDWLIAGGESGSPRRKMQKAWAESLQRRCAEAGTAFFFKQDSDFRSGQRPDLLGRLYQEFPPAMRAFAGCGTGA